MVQYSIIFIYLFQKTYLFFFCQAVFSLKIYEIEKDRALVLEQSQHFVETHQNNERVFIPKLLSKLRNKINRLSN